MSKPPFKKPELLAPAGTFEGVHLALEAGADAVYVAGKKYNMRQHRPSYNLGDEELCKAVQLVHAAGKKIYVALNSLVFESELGGIRSFLALLQNLQPDGLIVQDLAVAVLTREICADVPLHASTMMNINSAPAAQILKSLGFCRIVASQNITLAEARRIGDQAEIDMEYFVHGDLCVAQCSQCLLSGIVRGESSNRGRCLKPCRWFWRMDPPLNSDGARPITGHLMARKDMCLLAHIPALFQSRISSVKIEGRMRTAEFLASLIKLYRQAIDAYAIDPQHYEPDPKREQAVELQRVRDLCTGHAFGRPQPDSIDSSGRREPHFFSLTAPKLGPLPPAELVTASAGPKPELIVRVATMSSARAAFASGADAIYVGGDDLAHNPSDCSPEGIENLLCDAGSMPFRMALLSTRVSDELDLKEWAIQLDRVRHLKRLEIGVSNLGALAIAREKRCRNIIADFALNSSNSLSVDELRTLGVARVTAGLEMNLEQLEQFIRACRLPVEVICHGSLDTMLLEYCLIKDTANITLGRDCSEICQQGPARLMDTTGNVYPVVADRRCRNHILSSGDFCFLPQLVRLLGWSVAGIRIEAQHYAPESISRIVGIYRQALDGCHQG